MNVIVVGYGSIGKRHSRILKQLKCSVSIVSRRDIEVENSIFPSLESALISTRARFIVIANETKSHSVSLRELVRLGFEGSVLVEKPVTDGSTDEFDNVSFDIHVAYNFRFHSVIQRLKALVETEKIISVVAYVGQYLPNWRPGTDYRQSYSSQKKAGGGVLRDLSHELDFLTWLFGPFQEMCAIGGQFSHLEIDSDDMFSLLWSSMKCKAISLQLNYLDRTGRRFIVINADDSTLSADLISGEIRTDSGSEILVYDRDMSYKKMLEAFLSNDFSTLCPLNEGMEIVAMIEAAESSSLSRKWVVR